MQIYTHLGLQNEKSQFEPPISPCERF